MESVGQTMSHMNRQAPTMRICRTGRQTKKWRLYQATSLRLNKKFDFENLIH